MLAQLASQDLSYELSQLALRLVGRGEKGNRELSVFCIYFVRKLPPERTVTPEDHQAAWKQVKPHHLAKLRKIVTMTCYPVKSGRPGEKKKEEGALAEGTGEDGKR